jgi:spore coat polysaccharide biosynthesis protein SpsF
MRIVAILQARVGSTRLPGKVLMDLGGEPMLARVVNRVQRARTLSQVVVATTNEPRDDAVAALAAQRGWAWFRGSTDDVLDRFYHAALAHQADVVVRVSGDCPLIDPAVIDQIVTLFLDGQPELAFADNRQPAHTFPIGLDAEVMRLDALTRAWHEDANPAWREHVTPYIIRHPELFRQTSLNHPTDLSRHRWTVDTPADFELVQQVYAHFGQDTFTWAEALALLEAHPEWSALNEHVEQRVVR